MLVSMCGSSHQNNFLQNIDVLLKAIKKIKINKLKY